MIREREECYRGGPEQVEHCSNFHSIRKLKGTQFQVLRRKMLGCEEGARLRYRLTLVSGLLECLCFAGVVFGWASLAFVLKVDGYFIDLCVNVTEPNSTLLNTGACIMYPSHHR